MSIEDDIAAILRARERVLSTWGEARVWFEPLRGKQVILQVGKYKGRVGVLSDMCLDETHGLLFQVDVLRADGSGNILNSDGASRSCHPWGSFRFLEREFEG